MIKENGMVMMTEKELDRIEREKEQLKTEYEKRIELLQTAVLNLTKGTKGANGVRVSKADFLAIYQSALDDMWERSEKGEDNNDIYGYDFTIHWHGIYCNCGDGATPSNYIIPGIEGCIEEDSEEY